MKKPIFPEKAYKNLDFLNSTDARIIRILSEYLEPLSRLRQYKVNSSVLFFGSSRIEADDKNSPLAHYYWEAEELACKLAKWAIKLERKGKNFVICTGGGPGIMEAANRGAHEAGMPSIGMNIVLPHEQAPNPYITPDLNFQFHYFAVRKMHLLMRAKSLVVFPGGFGTLDELFETLTLIQTHKVQPIPVLLFGKAFWERIINFDALVEEGTISAEDLKLFVYVETAEEAWELISKVNEL